MAKLFPKYNKELFHQDSFHEVYSKIDTAIDALDDAIQNLDDGDYESMKFITAELCLLNIKDKIDRLSTINQRYIDDIDKIIKRKKAEEIEQREAETLSKLRLIMRP